MRLQGVISNFRYCALIRPIIGSSKKMTYCAFIKHPFLITAGFKAIPYCLLLFVLTNCVLKFLNCLWLFHDPLNLERQKKTINMTTLDLE